MSSWTEVRIGGLAYSGSQNGLHDLQVGLFNEGDLVRIGSPEDADFQHLYRITVAELRRRLEALGYALEAVRISIVEALTPLYATLESDNPDIPHRSFLDFACGQTPVSLIEIVRSWRDREIDWRDREHTIQEASERFGLNTTDFPRALVEFLQGGTPFLLPDDRAFLYGYAFERLLCEVYEDQAMFELDLSDVIASGHVDDSEELIGNAYDAQLCSRDPSAFVRGAMLDEEESESLEFKSVAAANVCSAIAKQIPKYLVGFLNRNGGRILFGVGDTGIVEGINIRREQRDELHRLIAAACVEIVPSIPLGEIGIAFRPVVGAAHHLDDCFVVEITVPQGPAHEMYFRKDATWVRFGRETRSLAGHQLFTHILATYRNVRSPEAHLQVPPRSG